MIKVLKFYVKFYRITKINNLNISNNNIGDDGIKILSEILSLTQINILNISVIRLLIKVLNFYLKFYHKQI